MALIETDSPCIAPSFSATSSFQTPTTRGKAALRDVLDLLEDACKGLFTCVSLATGKPFLTIAHHRMNHHAKPDLPLLGDARWMPASPIDETIGRSTDAERWRVIAMGRDRLYIFHM